MKVEVLLPIGKSERSNLVYPREEVVRAVHEFNLNKVNVGTPNQASHIINPDDASHLITDLYIEDDKVYADIEFLSTDKGKMMETLSNIDVLEYLPVGMGRVENRVVTEYQLISISASTKRK